MDKFSELCQQALRGAPENLKGDPTRCYYVYALIDLRTHTPFYIGKGKENRIFDHEAEVKSGKVTCETKKQKIISEIIKPHEDGTSNETLTVEKVIIKHHLTEDEAFKTEAALINLLEYLDFDLANEQSGHDSEDGAMTVEFFERKYAAVKLKDSDIQHNVVCFIINQAYKPKMDEEDLYNHVRGNWRVDLDRVENVEYVFGIYNKLIVAIYKPDAWYKCKGASDDILPPQSTALDRESDRSFFVSDYKNHSKIPEEIKKLYFNKSVEDLSQQPGSGNPVYYINKNNT